MSDEFGTEYVGDRDRQLLPHPACQLHAMLPRGRYGRPLVEPVPPVQVAGDRTPLEFEFVGAGAAAGTPEIQKLIAAFCPETQKVPVKKHVGLELQKLAVGRSPRHFKASAKTKQESRRHGFVAQSRHTDAGVTRKAIQNFCKELFRIRRGSEVMHVVAVYVIELAQ